MVKEEDMMAKKNSRIFQVQLFKCILITCTEQSSIFDHIFILCFTEAEFHSSPVKWRRRLVLYIRVHCGEAYCIVFYQISSYCIKFDQIILNLIILYCIESYRIVLYQIVSYCIESYYVTMYQILTYCFKLYHIVWNLIVSNLIE